MIARIQGIVVDIEEDEVVVDVGGVGYLVAVPASLAAGLGVGEEVTLQVHTQVREDSIQLFGFAGKSERRCFELLLTVPGVGARTAIGVLGVLSVAALADAVARQDLRALQRAPGVGRKVAQRIAVDLQDKLGSELIAAAGPIAAAPPREQDPLPLALAQLGYKRSEIERAQAWLEAEGHGEASLQEKIRLALAQLSGG
ncbi:MAG: Holliday junction branch migration protein RuvA [Pseudomonadota bacterium]